MTVQLWPIQVLSLPVVGCLLSASVSFFSRESMILFVECCQYHWSVKESNLFLHCKLPSSFTQWRAQTVIKQNANETRKRFFFFWCPPGTPSKCDYRLVVASQFYTIVARVCFPFIRNLLWTPEHSALSVGNGIFVIHMHAFAPMHALYRNSIHWSKRACAVAAAANPPFRMCRKTMHNEDFIFTRSNHHLPSVRPLIIHGHRPRIALAQIPYKVNEWIIVIISTRF